MRYWSKFICVCAISIAAVGCGESNANGPKGFEPTTADIAILAVDETSQVSATGPEMVQRLRQRFGGFEKTETSNENHVIVDRVDYDESPNQIRQKWIFSKGTMFEPEGSKIFARCMSRYCVAYIRYGDRQVTVRTLVHKVVEDGFIESVKRLADQLK